MFEQIWNFGISKLLSYSAAILLLGNIIYVSYIFWKKRIYYDNLFITFAIYFTALVVEPISASIKFNTKYGYEIIDLFYLGVIVYIIMNAILRNNHFFMYNMTWENFYSRIKEVLRKRGIDTYYRKPTIYIGNGEASISHSLNLFSKKVIVVKCTDLHSIIDMNDLKSDMLEYDADDKFARYYYLLINLILTIILLVNIRY